MMTRATTPAAIRTALTLAEYRGLGTEELLARYLQHRDELAFRSLVERYAGVVARRCRAVLGRDDLAEDAFQETFIRLATRAAAVRRAGRVGAWLAVTADRVALNVGLREARRRRHEMAAAAPRPGPPEPGDEAAAREAGAALLRELTRLPDRYRLPLECVYLDGMTHAEAAGALGLPKGTVDSSVARGLARLRAAAARLGLAGVVAAAGGVPAVLAAAAPAVPAGWVGSAVRAAAAVVPLPAGPVSVVRAYAATRPVGRTTLATVVGVVACTGLGVALSREPAPAPAAPPAARPADPPAPTETLQARNRRVLEAETLPRVVEALRPLAINGGETRVTQLVVHDFRAMFDVELRHVNAPLAVAASRLRVLLDTRTGRCSVLFDSLGRGEFRPITLDRPIIFMRVPELRIDWVMRSGPLDRAVATLGSFPPDPRAHDAAARHAEELATALAPYRGSWRYHGRPTNRSVFATEPVFGPDVPVQMPSVNGTVRATPFYLFIEPHGRIREWSRSVPYTLTDGGRRLEVPGTAEWWEREPAGT